MSEAQLEAMGRVDYMILERPGESPVTGEVMPLLADLADRDIIRILDIASIVKDADGPVTTIDAALGS